MGHNTKQKRPEHPALPYMAYEARCHLFTFVTDFTVHDTCSLKNADPSEAFTWVVTPSSTHLAWARQPMTPAEHRLGTGTARTFATMVMHAFGADSCHFYMWDGYRFRSFRCAADCDAAMAEHEDMLAERKRAGDLADAGVA